MKVRFTRILEYEGDMDGIKKTLDNSLVGVGRPFFASLHTIKEVESHLKVLGEDNPNESPETRK
jgi:hypothetical protein